MKYRDRCTCLLKDSGGGWLGSPEKKGWFIRFGEPKGLFYSINGSVTLQSGTGILETTRHPLSALECCLSEGYIAAGYIGYEYSAYTDSGFIPKRVKEGDRFPDMKFLLFREEDMSTGHLGAMKFYSDNERNVSGNLMQLEYPGYEFMSNMSKDEYIRMVNVAKRYIKDGDIYQVNLSQRFISNYSLHPLEYFLRLFHVQHVPFGCYMDFGDFQLISGSMELFLQKIGDRLVTRPIKGTWHRGKTPESDIIKKAKLVSSEKERAENLMIVDLMRNDLSRVCVRGSVRVRRLFDIESYSTLHQMVSEVEGHLKQDHSISSIIGNIFPPGSVTGAPKRRSLEVIDELEPHYRGPYCGAIGLFFPNGDFTLSVGIRLMTTKSGRATYWTGGGIVWDSDPEGEYEETLLKSLAIKKALGLME
ncbi:MAG: aminodeoxychorismate synthase component I [Thermodesulfobacteriota bacterium]